MVIAHRIDLDVEGLDAALSGELAQLEDRYRLTWPNDDYLEFHRNGDAVHIDYVLSMGGESRLTQLAGVLPSFFRARGVHEITAAAEGPQVEVLERMGMIEANGLLYTDLEAESRVDDYVRWKKGEGPEPDWR